MISQVTAQDVLSHCRNILKLTSVQEQIVDDELLAGLLRRCAGVHCPCSKLTLRSLVFENLKYLDFEEDTLSDRLDNGIENLIIGGDLLEFNEIITDDTKAKGTWVYPAPPTFVIRRSGGIYLLGIVPDQDLFLPSSITDLIIYDGFTRLILPKPGREIENELRELGLYQLCESSWLKGPKKSSANLHLDQFQNLLSNKPPSGSITDLKILDSKKSVNYYKGRWTVLSNQTGTFVARRPQEYGTDIWCLVKLEMGKPTGLIDLPVNKSRWRGCDTAWHLQMAIDYLNGNSQKYRRTLTDEGVRFDFFSPLPLWSKRRFMLLGQSVPSVKCLFSYLLPYIEVETEEHFLQESLWLFPTDDSD